MSDLAGLARGGIRFRPGRRRQGGYRLGDGRDRQRHDERRRRWTAGRTIRSRRARAQPPLRDEESAARQQAELDQLAPAELGRDQLLPVAPGNFGLAVTNHVHRLSIVV